MTRVASNLTKEIPAKEASFANGKDSPGTHSPQARYTAQSTLAELPGDSVVLSAETTAEELGRLFTQQPDLSGVILFNEAGAVDVISQSHFYKCVSRAFGREIYYPRPARIMLANIPHSFLTLPSTCLIEAAVEACLNRSRDDVYEPFLVHDPDSAQYRVCGFQILVLASSQVAALRNRQMELILNSVTDGLLVIDKNYQIGGEYSRMVEKILERTDLRETSLPAVLQPLLESSTHENLQDYLKILFDPKLIDRLIKSINPAKEISARFAAPDDAAKERMKHFALNFERIRNKAEITGVLVQIKDITQQVNLSRELKLQEAAAEEKLQVVMQILQVEPQSLNRFNNHFNEGLAELEQILGPEGAAGQNPREAVHVMFRKVHTLKGEAAILKLGSHERLLHQLEDELDKCRSAVDLQSGDLIALQGPLEALRRLSDQIRQILDQVKALEAAPKTTPQAAVPLVPIKVGLIESISHMVADIGKRIGKPALFYTSVRDEDLPPGYEEMLPEVLMHLTRNSMVHGIESSAEREARGKNAFGIIQLEMKAHENCHEILFQDDGGGLDLDKIRRRAEQLGWNMTNEDALRRAIFEPGFSTADGVTELAGRGVGLDVVRHALEKVGGRILPHSQTGNYCAFQIILPRLSTTSRA